MESIWIWIGGVYALILAAMAVDAVARKTSWRELATTAAFVAGVFAAFGGVVHIVLSWAEQSGWGGLLAVIGFLFMMFSLCSALAGGILRLLYRD